LILGTQPIPLLHNTDLGTEPIPVLQNWVEIDPFHTRKDSFKNEKWIIYKNLKHTVY
jgi:hypothetical protein